MKKYYKKNLGSDKKMLNTLSALFIDFVAGLGLYSFKAMRGDWERWGITCVSYDTAYIILFIMYVFVAVSTLIYGIMKDGGYFKK